MRELSPIDMVAIRQRQLKNSLSALSRAKEALTVRGDTAWTTKIPNGDGKQMDIHVSLPLLRGIRSVANAAAEDLQGAGVPELAAHIVFDHNQAEIKRLKQRRVL